MIGTFHPSGLMIPGQYAAGILKPGIPGVMANINPVNHSLLIEEKFFVYPVKFHPPLSL